MSLIADFAAGWDFQTERHVYRASRTDQVRLYGSFGCAWRPVAALTVSFAAGLREEVQVHPAPIESWQHRELMFGSMQRPDYRDHPLLRVHITPTVALDFQARWGFGLRRGSSHREQYALGFTFQL